MWLNKEQIKEIFYFSIEFQNPNTYSINITYHDYIELCLEEQYIYYVNEENKEMNFAFYYNYISIYNKITIWAKGEKELNTSISLLSGFNYTKHSKYNSYIIQFDGKATKSKIYLKVIGKIGDIINIGSIIFNEGFGEDWYYKYNIYWNYLKEEYYLGFLKKGVMENNCFYQDYSSFSETNILASALDHNNIEIPIVKDVFIMEDYSTNWESFFCINLTNDYDELFYSIYFLNNSRINKNTKNIIFKTILGVEYSLSFPIEYSVVFIPINPTENFNYLTFSIKEPSFPSLGISTVSSIILCDKYPLCSYPNDTEKKIEIKKFHNSFEYTFTKDELGKDYSPMNKEQKLMAVHFEITSDLHYSRSPDLLINIYTEKSYVRYKLDSSSPVYKLIREDQTEKVIFENNDDRLLFFIEKISGEFSINTNLSDLNVYQFNNFYIFDKNFSQNDFDNFNIYLNITASKDSIYTYKKLEIDTEYLDSGLGLSYILKNEGNYIFKFDNGKDIILNIMEYFSKGLYKLINLYSPNCKIGVRYMIANKENNDFYFEELKIKNDFFQEIYNNYNRSKLLNIYLDEKEKNKQDLCLLLVSNYDVPSDNNASNYSIILDENSTQLFAFNEKRNLYKFSFYHGIKNEDINIRFNLLNSGKYDIRIFVEGTEKRSIKSLNSKKTINLKPDDWNNLCRAQERCNISFTVLSKNPKKESYLKIIINGKEEKDKDSSSLKTFLIIGLIIAALIIIIVIIFIILRLRRKSHLDEEEINNLPEERECRLTF